MVATSTLAPPVEKSARPNRSAHPSCSLRPISSPSRSGIDDEFSRLAQRTPTHIEEQLLALVGKHLAQPPHEKSATDLSIWVDGLLAESALNVAVAAGSSGARVLFVSPMRDQMVQRQLRLGRRAPFFALAEGVKRASEGGAETAWATPDELDASVVARVFGAGGPDLIVVEDVQAASPISSAYRPSFDRLRALLQRYPRAFLLCASSLASQQLRQDVAARLARPELSSADFLRETALFSESRVRFRVVRQEAVDLTSLGENSGAGSDPKESLAGLMGQLPRPAVLLCATVAQADEIYGVLLDAQLPVHRYHAGMPESDRARHLLQFALPGRRALMVATSGFFPGCGFSGESTGDVPENFGPGYSRRDIRSLVHLAAPSSVEQFALELRLLETGPRSNSHLHGVADAVLDPNDEAESREPSAELENASELTPDAVFSPDAVLTPQAVSLLIYHPAQLALSQALLERKRPGPETLMAVASAIAQRGADWVAVRELAENGLQSRKLIQSATCFLVDAGLVEQQGDHLRSRLPRDKFLARAETLSSELEQLCEGDERRLREVASYAEAEICRKLVLEMALGRKDAQTARPCGHCDVCSPANESLSRGQKGLTSIASANEDEDEESASGDRDLEASEQPRRRTRRPPARQALVKSGSSTDESSEAPGRKARTGGRPKKQVAAE